MDHLGYVRSGMRASSSKLAGPQKNAYARLVQQHRSGRFRSYLNHVAQKMQLEEMGLSDTGSDVDVSLKKGMMREAVTRNGLNVPDPSPNKASLSENPDCVEAEEESLPCDGPEAFRKGPAWTCSEARQSGPGEPEEAGGPPPAEGSSEVENLGWALSSCSLAQSPKPSPSGQKAGASHEKDVPETGHQLQASPSASHVERAWEVSAAEQQPPLDSSSLNSEKAGPLTPDQLPGSRARKGSELSSSTPSSLGKRRPLLESDAMSHLDGKIHPKHLGTPKGASHAVGCSGGAGSSPGDKKMSGKHSQGKKRNIFEAYMSRENVSAGLKRGALIQEISEHGSEEEDDSLSAITYESDLEMKSPKKTFQKCPPGPPKSPCYTKSKQIASWRSVKTAGTKPLSGRMALTPQKIMLRPSKQSPGAPAYKEKEAIYDEISELKKSLHSQKGDVDFMKTKLRQLEESNKKHQNMDPLLDPNQDSESVWNVIDKSSGSGWIIHGLKQRIIRLEQQCKEKDSTITKLQTDMKMTNLEEMRIAVDTYSEEIHRLQVLVADTDETERKSPIDKKSSQRRQKKLRAAVLYLSRTVQELQEENRSLKEDLDRVLSNSPVVNKAKSYSEWSKQRLMRRVSELEKRVGELENTSSPPERAMLAPSIRLIPNTALQGLLRSEYAEECE